MENGRFPSRVLYVHAPRRGLELAGPLLSLPGRVRPWALQGNGGSSGSWGNGAGGAGARATVAQMAAFTAHLEASGLELVDCPSAGNNCGYYAVLSQVGVDCGGGLPSPLHHRTRTAPPPLPAYFATLLCTNPCNLTTH